jgi:hypothetical protein
VVHAASVVEEDVLVSDHEVFMTMPDHFWLFNPDAIASVEPTTINPTVDGRRVSVVRNDTAT